MKLFNQKSKELNAISKEVEMLDSKLDEEVFTLYGITSEERKIIEASEM
jgi:Skp family chaperone for outer membrane proteins